MNNPEFTQLFTHNKNLKLWYATDHNNYHVELYERPDNTYYVTTQTPTHNLNIYYGPNQQTAIDVAIYQAKTYIPKTALRHK